MKEENEDTITTVNVVDGHDFGDLKQDGEVYKYNESMNVINSLAAFNNDNDGDAGELKEEKQSENDSDGFGNEIPITTSLQVQPRY